MTELSNRLDFYDKFFMVKKSDCTIKQTCKPSLFYISPDVKKNHLGLL